MGTRRTMLPRLVVALITAATLGAACSSGGDDAASSTESSLDAPAVSDLIATNSTGPAATETTAIGGGGAVGTTTASPTTTEPTIAPTTSGTPASTAPLTTTTTVPATTPDGVPVVEAAAYAVFDMRSGERLAASAGDEQRPVGSLMKLLTAYVAYEAGEPTRVVTAPEGLVLFPGDESIIGIGAGQQFSRDTLTRAMLKVSANDAARMLAIDIAGSEVAYAGLMNATAASIGLENTRAVNVTGLDAEGQYSSANDMIRLGVGLMGTNITFQQTVKEDSATLNGQGFPNTNDLLGVYPGADGIKTGRTTGAGWCILASAQRDGRRIVVAVLGAPTEAARDQAATALLDYGFAQP